jgi:multiple sugar transport system permease protein
MRKRAQSRGYLFILPAMLVLGAMILYPIVDTAILSFTDASGAFVGFSNFASVLRSPLTGLATYNSFVFVFGSMVVEVAVGTIAGIMLDRHFVGRGLVRSVLLIPWVVPGIVAATTWAWMLHYEFGIINYLLQSIGVVDTPIGWLTSANLALPSVIAVDVWKLFPFVTLMVLAALQGIPQSLYEAARVDGASFLDEVRFIMLPHLRTVLLSVSLLLLIWGFNAVTIIYVMTGGGPANRTLVLPLQIFREAFQFFDFNRAAALSLMLFAMLFVVIVVQLAVSQRAEEPLSD